MADTRAIESEYIQIKDLPSITQVKDTDLFMLDDGTTEEKKGTIGDVKSHILDSVDTKLEDYPTTTDMENAIAAASPKVSQEDGNIVELKRDGLFVSEDISGKVESFTQEAYNELSEEEKNNGQIRVITDTEPKKVMLNGMDLNEQLGNEPIGSVILFPCDVVPQGWLGFDGTVYNKSDYPRLWNVLPNAWKISEEQFRLPNLKGRVPQGADNNLGELIEAGLPNITGTIGDGIEANVVPNVTGAFGITTSRTGGEGNGNYKYFGMSFDASKSNSIYGNSDTVQMNAIAFNYIIKATDYTQVTEDVLDDSKATTGNVWSASKVKSLHTYSTEETVIGEFLGKPLYGKVIMQSFSFGSVWTNIYTDTNISRLIHLNGVDYEGGKYIQRRLYNGIIQVSSDSNVTTNGFILEYTKTTD